MTLKELRLALHNAKAKGKALIDTIKADGDRAPSDDEVKALDAIEAKVTELTAKVAAADRLAELERTMAPMPAPPEADPGAVAHPNSPRIASNEPDPATTHGFADIAEFAHVAMAASPGAPTRSIDERLYGPAGAAPTNFHQEGGSADGYMVPPAFRDEIWEVVTEENQLMGLVEAEPTESNSVSLLRDESTAWGATGVQANWAGEGVQLSASRLVSKGIQVQLNKLYAFVLATDEILEDAPRLATRLTRQAGRAISWKMDETLFYGTGAGQPLGWFNSGAMVSVAKEGSQVADTIVTENVAKMFSRLLPAGLGRSVWLANSDVMPQLLTMVIANQPVWTMPGAGLRESPGGFLMGRPIIFTGHAKTLGDKGDIQLIDPLGYYLINKARGTKFDRSIHLFFDYGVEAFRWTFRFGGLPFLSAPVSPANGSNTQSHFVTLDERA